MMHAKRPYRKLPGPGLGVAAVSVKATYQDLIGCRPAKLFTSMSFDDVEADLIRLYQIHADDPEARLREEDVQRWSASLGIPRSELYDRIAVYLARGFNDSELSFEFCDAIVNDLHGIITFADEERPDLFWKVYLAFDEGENYHGNDREQDPVDVYTRPWIARIVSGVSS